ncbi:MAG: hypothetical protein FWG38_11010 [Defluviitaleaceae bacterium]|nr:hypothetical protein [Defluviitaleaceae bacterium]
MKMPEIPGAFVKKSRIGSVLSATINEFVYEEKRVIFLYNVAEMSIEDIAALTELPVPYIVSILTVYAERLEFKLNVFKKAVPYNPADMATVADLIALESQTA